jgi:hypothetical protein
MGDIPAVGDVWVAFAGKMEGSHRGHHHRGLIELR